SISNRRAMHRRCVRFGAIRPLAMSRPATRSSNVTRRDFLAASAGTALLLPQAAGSQLFAADGDGPFQATGTRVGEVATESAIVWTRLTKHPQRNNAGVVFATKPDRKNFTPTDVPVQDIEGSCPAAPGRVRLRYGRSEDLADAITTDWID